MSKLFKLKKHLTLDDTAKHLSVMFGESVTRADVLKLGLDGHLTISVDFVNHGDVVSGRIIPTCDIVPVTMPGILDEKPVDIIVEKIIDEHRAIKLDSERVLSIEGVWDLLMVGGERLDIEYEYQQLTGGPEVTLMTLDGAFICAPDDPNVVAQLQERFPENEVRKKELLKDYRNPSNYYPPGGLPEDSVLVVRVESIKALEKSLSETGDKLPATKTTNTYLKVISALSEALIDGLTGVKNTDAEAVLTALDLKGIAPPASKKTLANYLEEAKEL
jgi:hypothetical protein